MTSSVSGQDVQTESSAVLGYPSGQDGAILSDRDTGFVPQGKFGVLSYMINPLLTKRVQ